MRSRLRIRKLILQGEKYKRTLVTDEPLIIIKGDGFSGKSLFLKLIYFCLGSKSDLIDLTIQKELVNYCEEVFLEVEVNDRIFTLNRNIKNDKNMINIYLSCYEEHREYSPWKKKLDEFLDFLVDELGITLHTILRKKQGSNDLNTEKISLRDIMRFVFIQQNELGTNQFLENNNTFISGKNKEVFKIINDLIIPDIEEIEKEILIAQNEFNRLEKINGGLDDFLDKRKAKVLIELIRSRDLIEEKIKQYKHEKNTIVEKYRESDKKNIYYRLKDDINGIDSELVRYKDEKNNLVLSIRNKELLLTDYKEEYIKMQATLEAMKKVKITEHKDRCPLCNSLIQKHNEEKEENFEDIEKVVEQLDNKIDTLITFIADENVRLEKINSEIDNLNNKKSIYDKALIEYKQNIEVPYLSEIESINSIIRDLESEKNKISSIVDIHSEMDNNSTSLYRLEKELDKLKTRKRELNELEVREDLILERLNNKYRTLMKRFYFTDIGEDVCYISKENYMPYYSGASVMKHTSGCLLLCMQIAYLGAILELNHEEENNCHPGILMLDTLSNNIGTNSGEKDSIDPKTYEEIYKYLSELSNYNQIFIIDNTPLMIDYKHKSFIFRRVNPGETLRGLIDETENEI